MRRLVSKGLVTGSWELLAEALVRPGKGEGESSCGAGDDAAQCPTGVCITD